MITMNKISLYITIYCIFYHIYIHLCHLLFTWPLEDMQIVPFLHSGLSASQDPWVYPALWGEPLQPWSKLQHRMRLLQRSGAAVWKQQLHLEHLEGRNILWWVLRVDVLPQKFRLVTVDRCCGCFQRSPPVRETLFMWSRGQPFLPAAPTPTLRYPTRISSPPASARKVSITCLSCHCTCLASAHPSKLLINCCGR